MGLKSFFTEWGARRRGSQQLSGDLYKATRHIVGPTGWMWSNGWDAMEHGKTDYLKSFEPRVPPSIHISARDLTRNNMPVPLVERCIEDWVKDHAPKDHATVEPMPGESG
jgi:hypothetical protein